MKNSPVLDFPAYCEDSAEDAGGVICEIGPPIRVPREHGYARVVDGVGACSVDGCVCQGFLGNTILVPCQTCNHAYTQHADI